MVKIKIEQPKFIVLGTPKKPEKGQEWTYPPQELTFYVQEYRDITWNTKLGQIKTRLGKINRFY